MPSLKNISYYTQAQSPIPLEGFAALQRSWPVFIQNSVPALRYLAHRFGRFSDYFVYGVDSETGSVAGYGTSFPVSIDSTTGRIPRTWDESLSWSVREHEAGSLPNAICILDIVVDPAFQRDGIGKEIFQQLKDVAQKKRLDHVLLHTRPLKKVEAPYTEDDLRRDPWIAYHLRNGARPLFVAEDSMVIEGSAVQWEKWTGIRIESAGKYEVGGIVPMIFDDSLGEGIYSEPNFAMLYEVNE